MTQSQIRKELIRILNTHKYFNSAPYPLHGHLAYIVNDLEVNRDTNIVSNLLDILAYGLSESFYYEEPQNS